MSEIIRPVDYTLETQGCVEELAYRMANTLTDYEPSDFVVVKSDDVTFVLANPVLGEETMAEGEAVPMRNVTMVYYDGPPEVGTLEHGVKLHIRLPRVRVLRPDLCLKIVSDKITDCVFDDLEAVMVRDWEKQLKRLLCRLKPL